MPRRSLAPTLLLALLPLAACAPELNWREARPEGTALQLLFPCKPKTETRSVPLAGAPVEMSMVGCEAGDSAFALAHADVGEAARVGPALAELQQALASKVRAPTEAVAWPGPAGSTAAARWRVTGPVPDGRTLRQEAVFFARGTRVFQVVAMGAKLPADAGDTFFESIQPAAR
jgi:hypothetical protein